MRQGRLESHCPDAHGDAMGASISWTLVQYGAQPDGGRIDRQPEQAIAEARMKQYTPNELAQRTVARRAVEAVIWGMPAVNFDLMYQATGQRQGRVEPDRLLVASFDWKNQTLTPNPDTIYLMPFFNTQEVGPMVLEIRRPTAGRSQAVSTTPGRRRWRTSGLPVSTRARVESTSSCRRATTARCRPTTSRCRRAPTRLRAVALQPRTAAARPISPRRSPMASG